MFKKLFLLALILLLTASLSFADSYQVKSPNGVITVTFAVKDGNPCYKIDRFGLPVIKESKMGFDIQDQAVLGENLEIVTTKEKSVNQTWEQPWGEKREILDSHNELRIQLKETTEKPRELCIVFRVFDDGVGFRYEIPEQANLSKFNIMDELTEFVLPANHDSWWVDAYLHNRYEYLYTNSPVCKIDTVITPFTMESKDGLFLSIHEAALVDFATMNVALVDSLTLKADLVPWSDGIKVKTTAPMKTPWRTIQIGDTAGDLITSYLILNLNEPSKLDDLSWIEPGKYVGIWWGMHLETYSWASGPKHGATTDNTKMYMDFAAENGFSGVLVEGWNLGWDGDWITNGHKFSFTKPYPDFDMKEIKKYGEKLGVKLIGHHETGGAVMNYEKQLSKAFKYYEKNNVSAVKTGYVNYDKGIKRIDESGNEVGEWHHGQHMVNHYQRVVEVAAKHHVMVNTHEPVKDTGLRRTWPNMLSREGARGQEFNAWSDDGGNPPEHTVIMPFTRLLGGPMDFTPGIFDLIFADAKPNNRVNTTLMKQLALYVTIYSPVQMAADLPKNYKARPDAFQFIKDVPCDWEDTKVLNAKIGDYITTVRKDRNSNDWYLGSITDENGRILSVPLTFLEPGVKYTAEIYRDGDNANWETNPYDYVIEEKTVDNSTTLTIHLAPGGGQAIRFKAEK